MKSFNGEAYYQSCNWPLAARHVHTIYLYHCKFLERLKRISDTDPISNDFKMKGQIQSISGCIDSRVSNFLPKLKADSYPEFLPPAPGSPSPRIRTIFLVAPNPMYAR